MFTWNVEELKLRKVHIFYGNEPHFSAEDTTSREDMIRFLDDMNDGMMSYILDVIEKFKAEEDMLPKDKWNNVKTVSLKAWLKKNDPRNAFDRDYRYGRYRFMGTERYINSDVNHPGPYDSQGDLVKECFHRQLKVCRYKEDAYFAEHDPHTIALNRVREYLEKYGTSFGINLGISSKEIVTDCRQWGNNSKYTPQLTLEQCNFFIKKYEALEKVIAELSENAESDFDKI